MADKLSTLGLWLKRLILQDHQFKSVDDHYRQWPESKKADYVRLEPPAVIIEQKDIQKQEAHHILSFNEHTTKCLTKYNQMGQWPRPEGWEVADKKRYDHLRQKAVKKISKHFSNANQQIAHTREFLGLTGSYGVLLVVNQLAGHIPQDFSCFAMEERFEAHDETHLGLRYPNIDGFIYVHRAAPRSQGRILGSDTITVARVRETRDKVDEFVSQVFLPLLRRIGPDLKHPSELFLGLPPPPGWTR